MRGVKISIITVSLNAEKTIERAIKSVLSQSYDNVEYIIIDGSSTDKTVEIIRKYEEKISYWVSEADCGLYDAMNKGLDRCTGDVVAFLGSDDYYLDGALEYVADCFEMSEQLDILCGEVLVEKYGKLCTHKNSWEEYPERLREGFMIYCHQGVFSRRKCFEQCGSFDLNYRIVADYDWLLRVYNQGACFQYSPHTLCVFRYGGISSTNLWNITSEFYEIAKKNALELYDNGGIQDSEYERLCQSIESTSAKLYINMYLESNGGIGIKYKKSDECDIILQKSYSIFGAGNIGIGCLKILQYLGMNVECFWDNAEAKWGKFVEGISIRNPKEILEENTFIIVASQFYEDDIVEQLNGMNLCEGKNYIRCLKLCKQIVFDKLY